MAEAAASHFVSSPVGSLFPNLAYCKPVFMIDVALWQPEIPHNTGNIARLCAATDSRLHLIGRLGFRLNDRALRRAGLDYWPEIRWQHHATMDEFERSRVGNRLLYFSVRGTLPYTAIAYQPDDCLVFGGETRGLPIEVLEANPERTLSIPMPSGKVRSLNLATAAGIAVYEALRQLHNW